MLRFGKTKLAKEEFYGAKKPTKIWDVDVSKNNSRYLIGYLDDVIRPSALILPKTGGYVKTFKDKNNKLMSFCVDDDKLLEKYKTNWGKIEDLKACGEKVYTNFRGLSVPENGVQCESFTIISIESLFAYEKRYYLQRYLDNCADKIVNMQMIDYVDDNLFESDEN